MTQQLYWLGLSILMRNSPARAKQAVAYFGTPEQVWRASSADLQTFGYTVQGAERLIDERKAINLDKEMTRIMRSGVQIITLGDEAYPSSLRTLDDAPTLLYLRGSLQPSDQLALAMVGTRTATRYGLDAAHHFARDLARAGVTIISGLAQGIDTAAHHGALDGRGRTIAVLGNGIDVVYPRQNERLAAQIMETGALLSEYALGTPPLGSNFPRRNRLISGLARAVLVVEAPDQSGALGTASIALEQGRDVFAVPGSIFNPASVGANRLIQDGAKLVMNSADILSEFGFDTPAQPRSSSRPPAPPKAPPARPVAKKSAPSNRQRPLPPPDVSTPEPTAPEMEPFATTGEEIAAVNELPESERLVYERLSSVPIHIDEIIRDLHLTAQVVSVALTMLELKGLAENMGAMQYCLQRR